MNLGPWDGQWTMTPLVDLNPITLDDVVINAWLEIRRSIRRALSLGPRRDFDFVNAIFSRLMTKKLEDHIQTMQNKRPHASSST